MNEDNGKGYGCFVMLVSGVAIVFSIAALLRHDNWDCEISPAGFVITTLSALITFVVAWQIWTTIASKEEIKKATEAMDKIEKLEASLTAQRNLFSQRNLEIRHLIDAHARLHEAEETDDLSSKYETYAEAMTLLLQSNVDLAYDQLENARYGLMATLTKFAGVTDPSEAIDFISREKVYEWHYHQLLSLLEKRSGDIEDFKRQITSLHDFRRDVIADMQKSEMGKRIEEYKQSQIEFEKQLREREAARKAAEVNPNKTEEV